jgi:hypothetical protein
MWNFLWQTVSRLSFWRWEKIWFRNQTKVIIWGKWFCLLSYLIGWQAKARARSAGVAGFLHGRATIGMERLDRRGMKVGKIFSDDGCSFELTEGLKTWFLEYLNSRMDAGKDDDWNWDRSEIFSNTSMVPWNYTSWRQGSRRLSSWWRLEGWLGSRWWLELGWLKDQD